MPSLVNSTKYLKKQQDFFRAFPENERTLIFRGHYYSNTKTQTKGNPKTTTDQYTANQIQYTATEWDLILGR